MACLLPININTSNLINLQLLVSCHLSVPIEVSGASQVALVVKSKLANAGDIRDVFDPWENPLEEEWQPTPVFLPGEYHGQRSLAGYIPWGHKESDMTERLTLSLSYTFKECSMTWLTYIMK